MEKNFEEGVRILLNRMFVGALPIDFALEILDKYGYSRMEAYLCYNGARVFYKTYGG